MLPEPTDTSTISTNTTQNNADHKPAATSDTSAVSATSPRNASLQGIPPELRNRIYEQVAATDDRFVLGRRFVEAYPTELMSATSALHSATALHPLSMTCRQMREEFQGIHLAATESRWVLVVNNFDLGQIRRFGELLEDSQEVFEIVDWDAHSDFVFETPVYNPRLTLRFQLDNNALHFAKALCDYVLSNDGDAPPPLGDHDYQRYLEGGHFGVAEIVTSYRPPYAAVVDDAKSMTPEQASAIRELFKDLYSKIEELPDPWDESRCIGEPPDSFKYMKRCWFAPFCKATKAIYWAEKGQAVPWWDSD